MDTRPGVSIIVPCYNEQATISLLLGAIYHQTYPHDLLEVVIADGMSEDRTRQEIARFSEAHPQLTIHLVDNPQRIIPAGLNRAIAAAQHDIIVRLDAHCAPRPDYVERSVLGLLSGLGDNVGGVWDIQPGGQGWIAAAIAVAAAHPLGVGDALYRFSGTAQAVDTVPFGAFRKSYLAKLASPPAISGGPYDESLLTNEDYEFNTRIRKSGGRIWLDPTIRSVYYARPTLAKLARQYWRYGYWKLRMLRRYPETIRWRQALPPLFIISLLSSGLAALVFKPAGWLLLSILTLYFLILLFGGVQAAIKRSQAGMVIGIPIAIMVMHLCWGSGFLVSLFTKKSN